MEYNLDQRNEPGLEIEMIKVEGGIFKKGKDQGEKNEKPAHQVKLESFYIGKYPITQFQWEVIRATSKAAIYVL